MKIIEANKKEFMSKKEQVLQKKLIALLKDDGKGHKHIKYAERLADFIIKIVPVDVDPEMTAAISFDTGIIYISEGFLKDPSTFSQLSVLMRHEMAHNLMMHQIRMMHKITDKYEDKGYTHIKMSQSLHSLLNIIEDFEISNKRYTDEDKYTVRNMWLNGKIIGGLVTEDHRKSWESMPVEEMYDALEAEISKIHEEILRNWEWTGSFGLNYGNDQLRHEVGGLYMYADKKSPSGISDPEKLLNSKEFKLWAPQYQEIAKGLIDGFTKEKHSETDLDNILDEIAKLNPLSSYDIMSRVSGKIFATVYTPEEKKLARDIIKYFLDNSNLKQKWFNKIKEKLDNQKYSDDDLKKILNSLKGAE